MNVMVNKWTTAMAFNADRRELLVVDFRAAYVVDAASGACWRVVGLKGGTIDRLIEAFGVSSGCGGRMVFTNRADQTVKVYTGRGHHDN
jgi:hypothetical protein